ncbi:MAG: ABC transporter ATP-binding protein [bacterium]
MKKTYGRFFAFIWKYRTRSIASVVLMTLFAFVQVIQPYFYKLFIEALPSKSFPTLLTIFVAYGAIRFAQVVIDIVASYVSDGPLIDGARDARIAVFRKIQDLDFAYHLSRSTGSLISIFKRGDMGFFTLYQNLQNLYMIFVQLVVMLIIFGQIDASIMLLMLLTFMASLVATYIAIKLNIDKRMVFNKSEDHISSVIVDNLINYETVKYFGKEKRESARLTEVFLAWTKAMWGYGNSFRWIDALVGFSSNGGFFLILMVALNKYLAGNLSLANVILIIGFISSFYPRLFDMVYKLRELAKSHTDIADYFGILDLSEKVADPIVPKYLEQIKGRIVFDKMSFSYYEGKQNAIDNFSLVIEPGQSVAFVGQSGVGKTTIVKLLLRFFDVTSGTISIDGTNIKDFAKSTLRSYMGVVPQEPVLFNNTIAFNIGYGKDNTDMRQIRAAAKMANLDSFINTLPLKYDTQVGERGVRLSGGQKQRLAIARMILSRPDIIIFDEATSQLDSVSERLIQDAFWKVSKNKTTLIIAHRLSTVVHADKIVVMDETGIAEVGTHKELLQIPGGIYRHYWDLQVEEI